MEIFMKIKSERIIKTYFFIIILSTIFLSGCAGKKSIDGFGPEKTVFLKVNIHYQYNGDDSKASYANYTDPGAGHKVLHVNTPVKIEGWRRGGFKINDTEKNEVILFEYHRGRMEMTEEEYLRHITSPQKVSLKKLSEIDRKGIKDGRAYKGMTKEGVMKALGYPATHRTPSLEINTWTYWTNRFGTIAVDFDANGKVVSVTD
jgi:hypothetical protein